MNEDHHTEKEASLPATPQRRSFLGWLWGLLGVLACMELGWITSSILKSRGKKRKDSITTYIDAGMTADFTPGSIKAVPEGQFYIACLDDGNYLALSRTCTHLGCSVPWNENERKFICPCHGSSFDLTGSVLTPPAMRPLDYFPTRIENGLIRVDITKPIRREAFSSSQTTRV